MLRIPQKPPEVSLTQVAQTVVKLQKSENMFREQDVRRVLEKAYCQGFQNIFKAYRDSQGKIKNKVKALVR